MFLTAAVLFFAGFALCAIWLIHYYAAGTKAEHKLEDMKNKYVTEQTKASPQTQAAESSQTMPVSETPGEGDTQTGGLSDTNGYAGLENFDVPDKTIDFAALQEENPDIYAWITVPGTVIDYPIVQHPKQVDYYLDHNLDGSRGYPGCIYTEMYNSTDWEDPNTIIYGHNMKNGTMFANLHYYEDTEFFQDNPYVYIYTEDMVRVYRIFGAYEFSNAHLMLNFDFNDPDIFTQYLDGIFALNGLHDNFNRDLKITAEDKIITLATCISNKADRRWLVQAVLVAEGLPD